MKTFPFAWSKRSIAFVITCIGMVLSASTVSAESAAEKNWPSYRGAFANGVAEDADLPTTWDGETGDGVLWKVPIRGLGYSSPVVWGDRVFVTTGFNPTAESLRLTMYSGDKLSKEAYVMTWLVIALDRATGKTIWERVAHEGVPKVRRYIKASYANSTPATDGEHLVVMLGSEGLHTFDLDGNLLWSKDLGVLSTASNFPMPHARWGYASSPIIHDSKVVLQVDVRGNSYLAAFAVDTGRELWRTPRFDKPNWSSPTVAPRPDGSWQVAVNGWKHIGGYDLETGAELWKMAGGGDVPVPTPIVANDLLLITSAGGFGRPIYAIKLGAKGDNIKESEYMAWQKEKAGNYMQTPIAVGGVGYFCFDNGMLGAYDLNSGQNLFKERVGRAGFVASPVATSKHLYYTSERGDVYVVSAKRRFERIAVNPLGEDVKSTPAISGDLLLLRARRHLFAVGTVGDEPKASP